MDRYPVGLTATISATFTDSGGATVDPGTVTIGITRANGTVLVASLTATVGSGAASRTYTVSAANMALLDTLTATWTSATLGLLTTTVEVVGGFLFSIAEANAVKLGKTTDTIGTRFTPAEVAAMRTTVEQSLEDVCAVAFVPRYARETLNGDGSQMLLTRWPKVTALRSASITGTALTVGQLATVAPTPTGAALYYPAGWTAGFSNVVVGYEHGHRVAPERVRRAGLLLAKRWLIEGPVDDRATSMSNDDGTFTLVTPGRRGDMFDLPEVNAVVQLYGLSVGIA